MRFIQGLVISGVGGFFPAARGIQGALGGSRGGAALRIAALGFSSFGGVPVISVFRLLPCLLGPLPVIMGAAGFVLCMRQRVGHSGPAADGRLGLCRRACKGRRQCARAQRHFDIHVLSFSLSACGTPQACATLVL